jgi:lysine biosynthesis protein LysW
MMERPVTICPECSGEIDLTAAEPGDSITCVVCGAEWVVIRLDPPEIDAFDDEG